MPNQNDEIAEKFAQFEDILSRKRQKNTDRKYCIESESIGRQEPRRFSCNKYEAKNKSAQDSKSAKTDSQERNQAV